MTVPRSYHEKLAALRAALSHSHPGASAGELIEAALDLALEQLAKRRGLVKKPRREPPPSKPEHVPAHVRRAVWKRDGGKCQWPLESGGICGSTHQVELDHVRPRALGGPSTIENTRCACKLCRERHNLHYAESELMPRGSVEPAQAWSIGAHDAA
jgi:hypothetical protein